MNAILLLPLYISWHYSRALRDLVRVCKNFIVFIYNFFSIHLLLFSLFAPLQRMTENYREGVHPEEFFNTLIVNTIMRFVGAVARLIVIVFGICALCMGIVGIILGCVLWLFLPFITFFLLAWGCIQLIM